MKEYSKLSVSLFVLLVGFGAFCIYENAKSNRGMEIYDTKKLTTQQKDEFKDAINTGDAYVYYGDSQKAVEEFKKAEHVNPEDKQTLYRLASSQHNAKQYEEAEKTLARLENLESDSSGYWSFRAQNLSNIPTSLDNMKRAADYYEKATQIYISEESYMTYELKANIYFNLYKHYRSQRSDSENATQDEIFASKKFFEALADLKRIANARKICNDKTESFKGPHCYKYYDDIKALHDKLYDKYKAFPNGTYVEPPVLELQPVEYTQKDIDNFKKNRPQNNLPRKK